MTGPASLTPAQRLANSRRALVRHMTHHDHHEGDDSSDAAAEADLPHAERFESPYSSGVSGMWRTGVHVAGAWWRSHPARLAIDVAEPLIGKYAKAHPLKLLAGAAGVGALIVLTRPWRLISLTGVALAALKSTQVSGLVSSMLSQDQPKSGKRRS